MALILLDRTLCPICGNPLKRGDDIVSFAAFVANRRDPLHCFSDAAFHRVCLENHPLAAAAVRRSEDASKRSGPGNRRCVVCGDQITDPDDYFGTGFLTDDQANAAFELNYLQAHRSHFPGWARAAEFRQAMEAFLGSDAWEGPRLTFDPLPRWTFDGPGKSPSHR